MNTAVNEYNYRFKLTDYSLFDRNRERKVAIYGRVSTEHEAQLSALENQLQWYDDQVRYHPNWTVCDRYANVKATFTAEGRKKNCVIRLEEIEQISSLHRKENEDNAHFIKNPCIFTFLHRLPSVKHCKQRIQAKTPI